MRQQRQANNPTTIRVINFHRKLFLLPLLFASSKAFFPKPQHQFSPFAIINIVGDTTSNRLKSVKKPSNEVFSSKSSSSDSIDTNNTTDNIMTTTGIASRLARPNILELQPYRCARDDYSDGILLDANENAFGPTSLPTKSLDPYDNSNTLERYPDPYQSQLKELFCRERGNDLQPSNVFVGVGSDEAIDLLMRIFCKPGEDNILITPPTYGMYKVCAKVNDVEIVKAPLTPDFDLDIPKVRFMDHAYFVSFFGYKT